MGYFIRAEVPQIPTMAQPPSIQSFLIRFISEETADVAPSYRGSIRHVQSGNEVRFTTWEEVEHFVSRYVALNRLRRSREDDGLGT
ncbi:MAG: hypothetical protein D6775_02275 [Caldilineae bacterium]|nr:MAG: hypothetical protein D6775_02275 [Caldilineae bacterium]